MKKEKIAKCLDFRNIGTKEGIESIFKGKSLTYIEMFDFYSQII